MGWSGSLSSSSAVGSSITYSPDTSTEGAYTLSSFTAPKKGVYRFTLKGSGGTKGLDYYEGASVGSGNYNQWSAGGAGGKTVGYLLLNQGQIVHVGAGGTCCAAFAAAVSGGSLSAIPSGQLYFVAGGGGAGGSFGESYNNSGWNCKSSDGGTGGGSSGGSASASKDGSAVATGGTQSAGGSGGYSSGSYGAGGGRTRSWDNTYVAISGRGGDGYYGGAGGNAAAYNGSPKFAEGYGGSGGSGYVKTGTLTVNGKTYTSSTQQGGGAAGGGAGNYLWGSLTGSLFAGESGSVEVTYYAAAELPLRFNGNSVSRLVFNGTEVTSLVFNGTKIFFEKLKRGIDEWFMSMKPAMKSCIPT